MNEKQLIQILVNALSQSQSYVYQATKESFRADDVLADLQKALDAANKAGFMSETEGKPFTPLSIGD